MLKYLEPNPITLYVKTLKLKKGTEFILKIYFTHIFNFFFQIHIFVVKFKFFPPNTFI